ncbi:MAG: hypothetical protein HY329_18460 [Chloroflexi bacterium]|nr:hypothetical protein [Chloroflexota bacterium]
MNRELVNAEARPVITLGELCLAIVENRVPAERVGDLFVVRRPDARRLVAASVGRLEPVPA